jgi:hypothetical protein
MDKSYYQVEYIEHLAMINDFAHVKIDYDTLKPTWTTCSICTTCTGHFMVMAALNSLFHQWMEWTCRIEMFCFISNCLDLKDIGTVVLQRPKNVKELRIRATSTYSSAVRNNRSDANIVSYRFGQIKFPQQLQCTSVVLSVKMRNLAYLIFLNNLSIVLFTKII